ncbi:hypothetical protein BCR44DRAFT_344395 [Catenaria anguillulae PL171]|uniref:Uncharacterized protein n=1 Tax=Catenaria anguillulae PL171 TaxID=765915 RepID=A0A1Y2HE97_9FUNG|nr:hypothetical protein BCR44DRAFT_344395 [Catenaria anguillulae PL171]
MDLDSRNLDVGSSSLAPLKRRLLPHSHSLQKQPSNTKCTRIYVCWASRCVYTNFTVPTDSFHTAHNLGILASASSFNFFLLIVTENLVVPYHARQAAKE